MKHVADHTANAARLLSGVLEKRVDEKALADLEKKNSLFPRLDFRLFSSVPKL